MRLIKESRRAACVLAKVLVSATLAWAGLAGCAGSNLSESEIMSRLEGAGLSVERLDEPLITPNQRARLEAQPQTIFSIRVTDATGKSQSMTLVEFDRDWQATDAKNEGISGFIVQNWFFVGVVSAQIQDQIEAALR